MVSNGEQSVVQAESEVDVVAHAEEQISEIAEEIAQEAVTEIVINEIILDPQAT